MLSSTELLIHSFVRQHAYFSLLTNIDEEEEDGHGPIFQQCVDTIHRTLLQYTGFSTSVVTNWSTFGSCEVTCPKCGTDFNVQL